MFRHHQSLFVFTFSLITLLPYSSVTCSITEQKQEMSGAERSSRETGRKGKKPQELQQYFSVKDKSFPLYPLGPTIHALSPTVRLTDVFSSCL